MNKETCTCSAKILKQYGFPENSYDHNMKCPERELEYKQIEEYETTKI